MIRIAFRCLFVLALSTASVYADDHVSRIDGKHMDAFSMAYAAFANRLDIYKAKDWPDYDSSIENYRATVVFAEDHYWVTFILKEPEKGTVRGSTMIYKIDSWLGSLEVEGAH